MGVAFVAKYRVTDVDPVFLGALQDDKMLVATNVE